MSVKLAETIYLDQVTENPFTGAVSDADSAPTAEVFEENTDTPIVSTTATKRTSKTGDYRHQIDCTAGNGFEAGKSYNAIGTSVVAGVTRKERLGWWQVRAASEDDLVRSATPANTLNVNSNHRAEADLQTWIGTAPLALYTQRVNSFVELMGSPITVTFIGDIQGNLTGRVLGGGSTAFTGTGVRAVDSSGQAIAPAATALSTAQWTNVRAALLDYLDAAISSRNAVAPDNTGIGNALTQATAAATSAATAATQATNASAKLGAFTGSGTSTLFAWIKALFRKDAALPTDVGGTYDPSTDANEALREKLDAGLSGGGGGAATNVEIKSEDRTIRQGNSA